jgi:hypothetical protein
LLREALATLLIFLGVAFAAFLALVVVFFAVDFAAVAAFLALAGAFLAAALALVVVFFAVDFAAVAAFLALAGAFLAAALALVVVFFAVDFAAVAAFLALAGAFLAAALALVVVFFATDFTLVAAFAAEIALPAIASLKPAFCKDAVEDLANLATLSIFAATNFFADAALTLGSADKLPDFESVPSAAIYSPYGNGKQRSHFNTLIQLKSTTVELIAYKPTHRTYERGSWC